MEAVGQLPESLGTQGRKALEHSCPTRQGRSGDTLPSAGPVMMERRWGKGALRGPQVGETGSGEGRATLGALRPWSETCWAEARPGDLGRRGRAANPGRAQRGALVGWGREAAIGLESQARAASLT